MKIIKLSLRLGAVASYIPMGAKLADVGTDHGFIPIWCLQQGLCHEVFASDIHEGPLANAKKSAIEYGLYDKIHFICAPGLEGIQPHAVDTIVIAGMGGETMIQILDGVDWLNDGVRLVLQPQSKYSELQDWLLSHGFAFEKARLVEDSHKLYLVFSCTNYPSASKKSKNYYDLIADDPLVHAFAQQQLQRCLKEYNGIVNRLSALKDMNLKEDYVARLNELEKHIKLCKTFL